MCAIIKKIPFWRYYDMTPQIVRFNIQLTKACNQRCISCSSYEIERSGEIGTDLFKKAIKEAASLFPLKNIAFTGGEPTLYRDFTELAGYAKKFSPNVSVTTNGAYCVSDEQIQRLLDSGCNRFSFSYHGIGAHDEFTRTNGAEKRLRHAVEYIARKRSQMPDLFLKIGTLFDGTNIDGVEKVVNYANGLNIPVYIEILDTNLPVFNASKMAKEKNTCTSIQLSESIKKFSDWIKSGKNILLDEFSLKFIEKWFTPPGGG